MTEKNDFKLDVVSIRLVKEAPIYSEQSFNKPEEVAAVMGECMCQFDREVVCVVNLSSDLKPINKLCELIGIPLLDHIIVGGDNRAFFSFKEKGMIDNPRITLSTDYRNLDIKSPLVAEQGKAR